MHKLHNITSIDGAHQNTHEMIQNLQSFLLLDPTKCENLAANTCSNDLKRKMSLSEDGKSKSVWGENPVA